MELALLLNRWPRPIEWEPKDCLGPLSFSPQHHSSLDYEPHLSRFRRGDGLLHRVVRAAERGAAGASEGAGGERAAVVHERR